MEYPSTVFHELESKNELILADSCLNFFLEMFFFESTGQFFSNDFSTMMNRNMVQKEEGLRATDGFREERHLRDKFISASC